MKRLQLSHYLSRMGILLFVPAAAGLILWLLLGNQIAGIIGALFLGFALWNRYWGYLTKLDKESLKELFGYAPPFERVKYIRLVVWRAMRHWRTLVYPAVTLGAFILAVSIFIRGVPPLSVATLGTGLILVLNYPLNRLFDYHFHLSILDAEAHQKSIMAKAKILFSTRDPEELRILREGIRKDAVRTIQEINWRKQTFTGNEILMDVLRFIIPLLANAVFAVIYL